MSLRVHYAQTTDLVGVEAMEVETRGGPDLCVSYVRVDRIGRWTARLRPGHQSGAADAVQNFWSRSDAAMWLLKAGGYAQPPQAAV